MRQRSITRRRLTTTLVLLIAIVAAAGFCAVDAHAVPHHGGSTAPVLCIGAPDMSPATAPLVGLAVVGRAPIAPDPEVSVSASEVLEHPPKR